MMYEQRVLRGRIENYSVRRARGDFFFSQSDRRGMAATGMAASAMGLVGMGTGLMGHAMSTQEEADLVEFEIGGEKVQGLMWKSPFSEGDEVEVVAEKVGEVWQAFGVARPSDRTIAMPPHCSRGSKAHWRVVRYWWIRVSAIVFCISMLIIFIVSAFDSSFSWNEIMEMMVSMFFVGGCVCFSLSALIAWSVGRHYRGFIQIAEIVFRRLGWRDVENIDLPKRSMEQFKPGDPVELGVFYYRY